MPLSIGCGTSICAECGVAFTPHHSAKGIYCSVRCRSAAKKVPPVVRFETKYTKELISGCWLWTGLLTGKGYGRFYDGSHEVSAHRFAYSTFVAPIPAGLNVLHQCDTPACVNPQHLFLGTQIDNMHDALVKGRHAAGSRHYRSKLTEEVVMSARRDGMSPTELARATGTSVPTAHSALRGNTWKRVR